MSPISTKGLLKGAALAFAGAAALGAGSVLASPPPPPACVTGVLGTFATNTPCSFGTYIFTLNSVSTSSLNPSTLQFFGAGNGFGVANSDFQGSGSINFTVQTQAPEFFTGASLNTGLGANTLISTVPTFSLTSPGSTSFDPFAVTSISNATYTFVSNGDEFNSRLTFTSDVPVPLPIVGAGLAFGFTRKLRKRAKLAS
jgi:hypothetical protein